MAETQPSELTLNISAVERDTGLSKDTLRMWERRYGFPEPQRDAHGERVYPLEQVEKLRLIKRLMDRGHRPGKLMLQSADDLLALGSLREDGREANLELEIFLRLIKGHQLPELRRHLSQTLMKQGLQQFVLGTIALLNRAVGEAWMRGEIAVFEEHLYTEQVQGLLRNAVSSIQPQGRAPRVLLTSLPHESHGLGLLMVEALLAMEGAACVSLGTETPCSDIVRAAVAHRVDIVALSFSSAFGEKAAVAGLEELRTLLPSAIVIWAGGASVERMRRPIAGVDLVGTLDGVIDRVKDWRALHASL
jgi:DNA-binding transcriptional MerR regulator/methylmalonyl-CoA mutase cobalamin-binding subunit